MTDEQEVRYALTHISPDLPRDEWVQVGMAVRSYFGEFRGWAVWSGWSAGSDKWNPREAKAAWRSFRGSGITIGTMFKIAKDYGYRTPRERGDGPVSPVRAVPAADVMRREREELAAAKRRDREAAEAAQKADYILRLARPNSHPYLESKGLEDVHWLTYKELLVVPVRDRRGRLMSVQLIDDHGSKKFLSGSRVSGGRFSFGAGGTRWLCEGMADALSLRDALACAGLPSATVVNCFSAHNMARVGEEYHPNAIAIADNDESGAGLRAAEGFMTKWNSPVRGQDFNDFWAQRTPKEIAETVRNLQVMHNVKITYDKGQI